MIAEKGIDLEVQQNVIRSHFIGTVFVCFSVLEQVFSLALVPCHILSQVIGHPSIVGYRFHFIERVQRQIKLVFPLICVPPLRLHIWQAGRLCRSIKGFMASLVFTLLLWRHASYLPVLKILGLRGEGSRQIPANFSVLTKLCRYCLQQIVLAVSLQRATFNRLGSNLGCLGISSGPRWPKLNQI